MRAPPRPLLSVAQAWWLLAAGVVAFLPLAPHLPSWLTLAVALGFAWRAWIVHAGASLPSRWLLVALVAIGTAGVYLHYRMLFGQNPGTALLALFLALKQLEARAPRDGLAIVLLACFVLLTGFMQSQSIPVAAALFAATIVITATLAALVDDRLAPQRLLALSSRILMQALPFLIILFVLFPRVSGPLWGLPRDAHSGLTGLSDSMSPGSIGNLTLSGAIAFRVEFAGIAPQREQLYWRGPVLSRFDGRTWRPARFPTGGIPTPSEREDDFAYSVTIEPHNKPWLFLLETPTRLPEEGHLAGDYQVLAKRAVTQRMRYAARSRTGTLIGRDEHPRILAEATELPPRINPRTRALAAAWRARHAGRPDAGQWILDDAIRDFRDRALTYTLTPPLLDAEIVDGFLFDTRQGFCEHFAGAFVFAMRAAGVPARVVTGYQGGEMNPVDGNLVVHQYDAHAWAEIWLPNRGWVRVDPTAVSAPSRIEFNLAAAVPEGDPLPLLARADLEWLRDLRFRWDAVANSWNQWVLGYTPQRQRDFLADLGLATPDWRNMTVALSLLCGAVLFALGLWAAGQRRPRDPVQDLWLRACARLARRGLARQPWEGPRQYADRVAAARPDLAAEIAAIAELYAGLRYGRPSQTIDTLRKRITGFQP